MNRFDQHVRGIYALCGVGPIARRSR